MRKKLLFIIFCLSALTGFAQTANTHPQADDLKGKRIGVIGDSYVKNHKEPVTTLLPKNMAWNTSIMAEMGIVLLIPARAGARPCT